jgi:F420-non-reducing hydrogenase large subunit
MKATAGYAVEFSQFAIRLFRDIVLKNKDYMNLIVGDTYYQRTYYMGLVDGNNNVNFYDGRIRVVDPGGLEFAQFVAKDYIEQIAEHIEPWTYMKFPFLKKIGWKGFIDGQDSGIYRVGPLARLNVSDGMATPLAQREHERMYETLGGKPAHNTLAFHWARLIESLYAAERMVELSEDPELTESNVRNLPKGIPDEGIGVIEAPRGTVFHHYKTDEKGLIKKVNLIVGTQNNAAAISMSIAKAAGELIKGGYVRDGLLNRVEMAFRAYDPCLACATHSFPGERPLTVSIHGIQGGQMKEPAEI